VEQAVPEAGVAQVEQAAAVRLPVPVVPVPVAAAGLPVRSEPVAVAVPRVPVAVPGLGERVALQRTVAAAVGQPFVPVEVAKLPLLAAAEASCRKAASTTPDTLWPR
jgi:hypothetical protein